ncbi:MAG: hypothetical protein ABWZ76_04145 [Acidimicrobiales bacterium]
MDILLLCTANQCRSPMAEVLLRHRLEHAGVSATVASAGLYRGGSPATSHGVQTMASRGLDLTAHRSQQISTDLVRSADLIVGMTRAHIREVAVMDPSALSRSFTLKELVRAGGLVGGRGAGETIPQWLARVGADRRREDLVGVGHDPGLDVEDPVGKGRAEYEETADELDVLLTSLVDLAWPPGVRDDAAVREGTA